MSLIVAHEMSELVLVYLKVVAGTSLIGIAGFMVGGVWFSSSELLVYYCHS